MRAALLLVLATLCARCPDSGVEPDAATCTIRPRAGCCFTASDCTKGVRCYLATCASQGEGMCKPTPAPGSCWSNDDCDAGATCKNAHICPCGSSCFVADSPGTCQP